jgi:hypothetical protein
VPLVHLEVLNASFDMREHLFTVSPGDPGKVSGARQTEIDLIG